MSLNLRLFRAPGRYRSLAWLVGFVSVAWLAHVAHWSLVDHRFTTITAHQLYQSAQMPPQQLLGMVDRHGIRTVVDLRTAEQAAEIAAEQQALDGGTVRYVHLPAKQIPDETTILKFLQIVGDPANRPVLVHCHHGTGRSVLFSSLFRVEFENWNNEAARRAVEPLHWRGNFAADAPKGQYLLSYKPHHPKLTFAASNLEVLE